MKRSYLLPGYVKVTPNHIPRNSDVMFYQRLTRQTVLWAYVKEDRLMTLTYNATDTTVPSKVGLPWDATPISLTEALDPPSIKRQRPGYLLDDENGQLRLYAAPREPNTLNLVSDEGERLHWTHVRDTTKETDYGIIHLATRFEGRLHEVTLPQRDALLILMNVISGGQLAGEQQIDTHPLFQNAGINAQPGKLITPWTTYHFRDIGPQRFHRAAQLGLSQGNHFTELRKLIERTLA